MLNLNRRPGQAILLGNDVEIRILLVKPDGSVNVGISAPKEVRILREELLEREEKRK